MEDEKWMEAVIPEDPGIRRRILGKVLEIAVRKCFKSNVYRFGGKAYLQTDGAPIGMDLSGEIGRLVMARWDGEFMGLCEANHIAMDLNQRYVDDDNVVQPAIPKGYRCEGDKVYFKED